MVAADKLGFAAHVRYGALAIATKAQQNGVMFGDCDVRRCSRPRLDPRRCAKLWKVMVA
jgi:hypothetical protein